MPCWFHDKKELLNTPSGRDGISADVEAWYRKEGAKHIIDAGNKLGLYLFMTSVSFKRFFCDLNGNAIQLNSTSINGRRC